MGQDFESEEKYIQRLEAERLQKLRSLLEQGSTEAEQAALLELVKNRCGRCAQAMKPKIYKGVEIDICPACGAVLLDPGELQELAGEDESHKLGFLHELFSSLGN